MSQSEESPRSDRWIRIESLFEKALEVAPEERDQWLGQACGNDERLRNTLSRMLAADSLPGGLLDAPLHPAHLGMGAQSPDPQPEPALAEGTRVGPYRIVEAIAQGGMGSVYRAERADGAYQQSVALKVVRGSWIAGELERRFLRERQILARLDHPGIARLLDGGLTNEGSPYLAMELVSGVPITRWMSERRLDVGGRLRVFLDVCEAVQYAHQNLVLHRDLKPSNVLVTDEGRIRLLDFGIARLLESPDDEATSEPPTRAGALLLTPEYAAPEQLRGEATSTATDVYALGAVLYEILSGHRPFVLKAPSWMEMARLLQEDPRPLSLAPDLDRKTRRRFEGDLETIVRQAMRKEPAGRYPSVQAFADDIRRYLDGHPVSARPDTLGYRVGKYVRRHRVGLAAIAAVLLALLLGTSTTLMQARATRIEAARSEAVRGFLFQLFESADPYQNLGEIPDARELLARGVSRVDSLGSQVGPQLRVDLLTTLGLLHQNLGLLDESASLLQRAVTTAQAELGSDPGTATAWDALASTWIEAGNLDSARVAAEQALGIRIDRGAADTLLARSYSTLGTIAHGDGRLAEGVSYHRRALALDRGAMPGDNPAVVSDLSNLGLVLEDTGELEEAVLLLEEAVAMVRRIYGRGHPQEAIALGALATAVGSAGDLQRAVDLQKEALEINQSVFGTLHPEVARTLDQWGLWLDRQGDHVKADSVAREALAVREATLGPGHIDVGATLNNLAVSRYRWRDFTGAAEMQGRALAIWVRAYGEVHPRTATALNNLGAMQLAAGDLPGAERNLTRSLEVRRLLFPQGSEDVGAVLRNLGDLRRAQGRSGLALDLYEEARVVLHPIVGPDHWRIADADLGRGMILVETNRSELALEPLENALRIRSASFVEGDVRIDEARLWLGLALSGGASVDPRARSLLEQAAAAFEAARGADDLDAVRARTALERIRS